jgi:hypothetical protein
LAALKGKTVPRIWTEPARPLNRRTSLGFEARDFCAAIGEELIPFQNWFFPHAMELNKDKTPRFAIVLLEVGRQSGKSTIARLMALHRLYVMRSRLILGVAADVSLARENLFAAVDAINGCPWLRADLGNVRRANGDETINVLAPLEYDDIPGDESVTTVAGSRYKICAPSRTAGRGLAVDFLHGDEIREWRSWDPWAALQPTTAARPFSQILLTSNAGDSQSIVWNGLKESAMSGRSSHIGYFSWSAEPDSDPADPRTWQQSCPGMGYSVSERQIRAAFESMPLGRFKPEYCCIQTDVSDGAIDMPAWRDCADPTAASLGALRGRGLAACFDASVNSDHFTLAIAVRLPDDRVQIELAGSWDTPQAVLDELPGLLGRIKPQATAWFSGGPGGQFHAILRRQPGNLELSGGKAAEACMTLASMVTARRVVHAGEPVLDEHISGTVRLPSADGWRFGRRGELPCDAAYACAGAISGVLTLPQPRRARLRTLTY